jgi:uncharacterized protein (TIGR00369 family)
VSETAREIDWGPAGSKTISFYEPRAAAAQLVGISGVEYLEGIRDGHYPPPPIASLFALELFEVSAGQVAFRCVPDESMLNPLGLVHGGVLCTLMDSAMGMAVQSLKPVGEGYASIELKVSFLRPLPFDGSAVEVRGNALRVGRRVAFAEAHAYGADGELSGHATSSLAAVVT